MNQIRLLKIINEIKTGLRLDKLLDVMDDDIVSYN
jgi:hypothetical protein